MKRFLILIVALWAATSSASGQVCRDCSTTQIQQTKERPTENSHRKDWPERPKLSPFFNTHKEYYGRTVVKFAVNNDIGKKIKEVTWECTLVHPETNAEIAKYTLVTRKRIAPYKGAVLKEKVKVPLGEFYSKVISVNQVGKDNGELPDIVQAIQTNRVIEFKYTDGSVVHP